MAKKILGYCIFIYFTTLFSVVAQNLSQDSLALLDFFKAHNGQSWRKTWNTKDSIWGWYGVKIDVVRRRVVGLRLPNNNVKGDFMALHRLTALDEIVLDSNSMTWGNDIFLVPRLRSFSCQNCQLQGNIPANIGSLGTLLTLSLNNNQLTGSLPAEIYGLSNLQNLYLRNNQLQNSLDNTRIGGWQSLQNLDLSYNQLNDRLPQNLGTLFQLRSLVLSHNKFIFTVPTTLKDLYYLQKFDISYNFFEGGVNTIFVNMPFLAYVDVSHNQFNGLLAGIFSGLSNLTYLDFSFNNFKEFFSGNDLFNATQLTYLNTTNNPQMIGDLPSSIGNATNLRYLNLSKALLSSKLPNSLANLRQLEVLKLDSNRFEGEVPAEIDSLKNLKELYLAYNRFSRFPVVSQLKKLDRLSLERNQLGFESLETNWKLAKITTYAPQDSLLLTDNCEMRMPTGGTANTYFWYENNQLLPTAKTATLRPTARNVYRAEVKNVLVPNLTLYSRPITPTLIPPTTRLVRDTLVTCNPVNMVLDGGIADSYRWSTGDTTRTIRVTKSGMYKIRAVRSICIVEDSIRIRYRGVKENDIRGEQQICKNTIPKRIEGITEVFSIRPRFQWQTSTDLRNWQNTDTSSFIQPAALSQTTYYRRIAKAVICEADTSNIVKVTVSDIKITAQVQNNLCANESKGSIALQLSGGISPYRLTWQDNGSSVLQRNNLAAGSYTLKITDAIGCTTEQTFTITAPPQLSTQGSTVKTANCNPTINDGGIQLQIVGGVPPYRIRWNTGDTTATLRNLRPSDDFVFQAVITDKNNCSTTYSTKVLREPTFNANFEYAYNRYCKGEDNPRPTVRNQQQKGTFTATPKGLVIDPNTGEIDLSNSEKGTYTISYQINACSQHTTEFTVDGRCEEIIPNTITPNGDGANDTWNIYFLQRYPQCEVIIWNRWGNTIFQSTGYPQRWDGTDNGTELPVGTYFYGINLNNGKALMKGSISIVK